VKLKEWLDRRGVKNRWVADMLDVDPAYVSRWLKGERPPHATRQRIFLLTQGDVAHDDWGDTDASEGLPTNRR